MASVSLNLHERNELAINLIKIGIRPLFIVKLTNLAAITIRGLWDEVSEKKLLRGRKITQVSRFLIDDNIRKIASLWIMYYRFKLLSIGKKFIYSTLNFIDPVFFYKTYIEFTSYNNIVFDANIALMTLLNEINSLDADFETKKNQILHIRECLYCKYIFISFVGDDFFLHCPFCEHGSNNGSIYSSINHESVKVSFDNFIGNNYD